MYGHPFLILCLQAPHRLVYYEPENVVATHCGLVTAAALMRRYVLTRLAMPRSVVPIAPRIQAQNLYDSVSWLLLASNNKDIVLLVPTCIFAVLLQDRLHRALLALAHESQLLSLLPHLSFLPPSPPTTQIAPHENRHERSLR